MMSAVYFDFRPEPNELPLISAPFAILLVGKMGTTLVTESSAGIEDSVTRAIIEKGFPYRVGRMLKESKTVAEVLKNASKTFVRGSVVATHTQTVELSKEMDIHEAALSMLALHENSLPGG